MKRFLRLGVLRGGQFVDDRYIPEKGEVTVGSGVRNMVSLPGSTLPKEHVLFHFQKKHPVLHGFDGLVGEIALDGKTAETVEKLKARATKSATGWQLELQDSARGWLRLGDATFFFQIGPKPPPPPRRALPPGIRTGFSGGIEGLFASILAVIVAVEGLGIIAVHRRPDVDIDKAAPEDLDRFAEIIMPEKPKEEPKKEDDEAKRRAEEEARKKAEEAAKEAEKKKEELDKKKEEAAKDPAKAAELKKEMRDAVAKKGALAVLGSVGEGGGALANVFASGSSLADVGDALSGAGGIQIAGVGDTNRKGGGGQGGQVGIGDLGNTVQGGGSAAKLGEKARVAPQITIDSSDVEVESTEIDRDSLNRFIRMRIKSVQQCYEKELKRNPALKGKIVVRFVVTSAGRVGEVSIESNSMSGGEDVAACIVQLIKRWSFPFKPEDDVPVSFPFVFTPGG